MCEINDNQGIGMILVVQGRGGICVWGGVRKRKSWNAER